MKKTDLYFSPVNGILNRKELKKSAPKTQPEIEYGIITESRKKDFSSTDISIRSGLWQTDSPKQPPGLKRNPAEAGLGSELDRKLLLRMAPDGKNALSDADFGLYEVPGTICRVRHKEYVGETAF